ncbi:MAG: nitronate monooxygenase [Flavobacteriales bacterium]|nr:nitronate monooxygenase [Flavobacteriales bacterium]MDP4951990.1 nitronate monooxygenase [Flavobacteriales bacterium]
MNSVSKLFGIKYPIIQGGMIWCTGAKLVSAVSNAGGLGLLGAGSMYPDQLEDEIKNCQALTQNPFGVNLPLLYPNIEDHIALIEKYRVPIVFTSAGSPKKYTERLKSSGIKVTHVVSSSVFALKSQEAGVDAVVAEGFEAGGHNGREETTTLCLIPNVVESVTIPVIAAGGISCGKSMLAAMSLGAQGVQMGSRFVMTHESAAHENFKNAILQAKEGDTKLTLHEITPVRLLNSPFYKAVVDAYESGASIDELKELLGRGRAKKGMSLGNLEEGELEIGQVSARIKGIISAKEVIDQTISEFQEAQNNMGNISF